VSSFPTIYDFCQRLSVLWGILIVWRASHTTTHTNASPRRCSSPTIQFATISARGSRVPLGFLAIVSVWCLLFGMLEMWYRERKTRTACLVEVSSALFIYFFNFFFLRWSLWYCKFTKIKSYSNKSVPSQLLTVYLFS
jgi:hypothetical protein